MENIKIIRLKNGEDIVGQVMNTNGVIDSYDVIEPMTVDIDYRGKEAGLVMNHWLPVQLIKNNEAVILKNDILCFVEPNEALCEYYLNTVEKIHELLAAKNLVDELSDEELNDVMDAFEELRDDGFTLH